VKVNCGGLGKGTYFFCSFPETGVLPASLAAPFPWLPFPPALLFFFLIFVGGKFSEAALASASESVLPSVKSPSPWSVGYGRSSTFSPSSIVSCSVDAGSAAGAS
jgi:hypothetical protein